jgi:CubicO group peptidase (beta-lactamase class C family)
MRPIAASLVLVTACLLTTLPVTGQSSATGQSRAKGQPSAKEQAPPVAITSALPDARAAAAALPALHSLIVSRRGEVLLEYYAPNQSRTRLANIKSASKSIIAMLIGIAIDRKLIKSVDQPIGAYFPELKQDPEPRKQTITIEQLLTMRSGLETTSGANYGTWVRSRNWVRYALSRPLVSAPGTDMEYSTGTSHLLSAILTRVTKSSTHAFAQRALAGPLGFTLARWPRDPQGIDFGGNEMLMTPRQMLAIGELWRNGGEVRNRGEARGRRILPAAWIETSCVPVTRSRYDPDRLYGYGWWIQTIGGHQACFAWGFGGQYIFVFRELDLVVVVTSSTAQSDERFDYRRRLFALLAEHVLPVVAAAQASYMNSGGGAHCTSRTSMGMLRGSPPGPGAEDASAAIS